MRSYGGLAVPVSGEVFVAAGGVLVFVIGAGMVGCGGGGGGGGAVGVGCGGGGVTAPVSTGTVPVVSSAIGFPN